MRGLRWAVGYVLGVLLVVLLGGPHRPAWPPYPPLPPEFPHWQRCGACGCMSNPPHRRQCQGVKR